MDDARTERGTVAAATKIDFDMPRDQSGKINWDILGKILTAQILGETVYAAHVDKKHSERKLDGKFRADTDWEFWYEKNETVVLRKKSQRTCIMGRGVVAAPLEVVGEFIKDIQSSFLWDNMLMEARYVKTLQESKKVADYIGYQLFQANQHCGLIRIKRDLLYYARCAYTEDGKYVHSAMSIEDPDYPPHGDVPRMTLRRGSGFVAEPYHGDPSKMLLSYIVDIDTKGIPSMLNSQVLKRHPMAISRIRANLEDKRSADSNLSGNSPSLSFSATPYQIQRSSRHFEDPLTVKTFMVNDSSNS